MSADSSKSHEDAGTVPENEVEPLHIPDLPLSLRLVLLVFGWLVIVLGLAGLLLPGLQGVLLLVLGAAILSVASDSTHRWLERTLKNHPRILLRLNSFRSRLHARLSRRK